mgnify:CR=1 FL=1
MTGNGSRGRRHHPETCLEDMLDAVLAILEYTVGMNETGFRQDGKTCDAVLRRLEVLGEAAGRLMRAGVEPNSPAAALPLREIYDMRNALIHGYDGVDLGVVWQTVQRDIPGLRQDLERTLASMGHG